jgi:hypothetical protein
MTSIDIVLGLRPIMDKFLASVVMMLGVLQAESMFAGAYTISMQTDWARLGVYFRQQVTSIDISLATPEPVKKPKRKASRYIDLSTRPGSDSE